MFNLHYRCRVDQTQGNTETRDSTKASGCSSQKNPQLQAPPIEIEEDEKRIGGEMLYSVQTGSDYHLTSTEIRSTNYLV